MTIKKSLTRRGIAPVQLPQPDNLISRAAFVAMLHTILRRYPGEKRNRVSRYVTEATQTGALRYAVEAKRLFRFLDAANWARRKWGNKFPDSFNDWPLMSNHGSAALVGPLATARATGTTLPSTISECHDALARAYADIVVLKKRIAYLTPLAESKLNSIASGNKGGRPKGGR